MVNERTSQKFWLNIKLDNTVLIQEYERARGMVELARYIGIITEQEETEWYQYINQAEEDDN